MVRIQRRLSRKRYLGGKYAYEYERLSLDIPHKFHKTVKPFIGQDLDIEISLKDGCLVIALTPRKRFCTPNNTREKPTPERLIGAEFLHENANQA
ncbi:MAG: hypothetical protein QXU45_07115 [Candidatus Bathyarchaeia archaeon]